MILPVEKGYNNYLSSDLMKPILKPIPEIEQIQKIKAMNLSPIDPTRITHVIRDLHKGKAPGITGIPITYYSWGGRPMTQMLNEWYKTMEKYNIVPWNLKLDIKTPFPKFEAGAENKIKLDPANYRPIALQNSMYKIMDGCIKLSLEAHNKVYNIILPNQGGFKQKEGTIEHLFVIQDLFQYNKTLYCAFLDLQKAYDSVWRAVLFQCTSTNSKPNKSNVQRYKKRDTHRKQD